MEKYHDGLVNYSIRVFLSMTIICAFQDVNINEPMTERLNMEQTCSKGEFRFCIFIIVQYPMYTCT